MGDIFESPYDLSGLIDIHIHTSPDIQSRLFNDIYAAKLACEAGLKAILIKSHHTLTADRATIASSVVTGIKVFGGLVLNEAIGGLNPAAVEVALKMGAKQIWMPTRSAANDLSRKNEEGGISLIDEHDHLNPMVEMILDLISESNIILGTGHISPKEAIILIRGAIQKGVLKILVTHPESLITRWPIDLQIEFAQKGVYFERCFVDTTAILGKGVSVREIADHIRRVGVSSTIISTDFGQAENSPPVEGMRNFLMQLSSEGFSKQDIVRMAGTNPANLLEL